MIRPDMQAIIAGHCSRIAWGSGGLYPVAPGVFQSVPDFELLALVGVAEVAEPAVEAARQAGYISQVRILQLPDRLSVVGPSEHMLPADWQEQVAELDKQLVRAEGAMVAVEVWMADEELSSLALLLASAQIRARLTSLGFDIPCEEALRHRLAERQSVFPGLLDAAVDAEVELLLKAVA